MGSLPLLIRKVGMSSPMFACFTIIFYIYLPYMSFYLIPVLRPPKPPFLFPEDRLYEDSPIDDFTNNLAFFLVLHFFITMFFISYFRTFLTDPGKVPGYWQTMVLEELNRFDQETQLQYRFHKDWSKSVDYNTSRPAEEENINIILERNALSDSGRQNNQENNENEESAIPPALDDHKLSDLEDKFLREKGYERFCPHCQIFKPPRTHHCRECGRCVLKMDHHCPWVLNCIGFYNYKLFYNMLVYGVISILMMTLSFSRFIRDLISDPFISIYRILFLSSVLACMLMLSSLLTVFLLFHTILVLRGKSTIEFCDKKKKNWSYDRGIRGNLIAVFGNNPFLWFIPVSVNEKDEGVDFNPK